VAFWKHVTRIETYDVFRMPRKSGYKMDDHLRVEVVWDSSYYLATCADDTISLDYGMGKTKKAAIQDLLCVMAEGYEIEERYRKKGKLTAACLEMHEKQGRIFSKR
jgi:hypothetical protein